MDYTLTDRESAILGQEFLTWLWFRGDVTNGLFRTTGGEDFQLFVEQRVSVQGGEGDSKETATVAGAHSELTEAKIGLMRGKKVNKALLKFSHDAEEWTVQLKAEDFGLNTLKTPKVEFKKGEDDPDAAFLEKIYLVEKCITYLDTVYREFLEVRLSPDKWSEQVKSFNSWLKNES